MNAEANPAKSSDDDREDLGYTLSLPSGPFRVNLPFVIGVIADLSPCLHKGYRLLDHQEAGGYGWDDALPPVRDRRFHTVNSSNFESLMAFIASEVRFVVPNVIAGVGEIGVRLSFRSLKDLTPESIASQVPELHDSFKSIANESGMESRLVHKQLSLIIENEAIGGLTSTWCGIHTLVNEIQPDSNVQLRVMHISKKELYKEIAKYKGLHWDSSPLFKKLYDSEYGSFGGKPYNCIIADFNFGQAPKDTDILHELSKIAAAGHFAILASAAPTLLQLKSWEDLNPDFNPIWQMAADSYAKFRSLREDEDSRYLFLTLPSVTGHDITNKDKSLVSTAVDTNVDNSTTRVSINPSYLITTVLAKCFRKTGWFVPQSKEFQAMINEWGKGTKSRSDCDNEWTCLNDELSEKLFNLGFNRISDSRHRNAWPFLHRSLYCPAPSLNGQTEKELAGLSSLSYMSCANHIVHYIHSIVRDRCPEDSIASDCFNLVMEWLNGLSTNKKKGQDLLAIIASDLSEGDRDIVGSLNEARIELEFIRGFPTPGPMNLKVKLPSLIKEATRQSDVSNHPDVVIGVLMDLSRFSKERPEIAERFFIEIDADNFDYRIKNAICNISFMVKNFVDKQDRLPVDIQLEGLLDFEPDRVALHIEPLARLLEDRNSLITLAGFVDVHLDRLDTLEQFLNVPEGIAALQSKIEALIHDMRLENAPTELCAFDSKLQAWIDGIATEHSEKERAKGLDSLRRWHKSKSKQTAVDNIQALQFLIELVDSRIARQLEDIIHHVDFQLLESVWRGLWHLVSSFQGNDRVRIVYIDVSKEECFLEQADLEPEKPFVRGKSIYDKIKNGYKWSNETFDILISDHMFNGSSEDLAVLKYLNMIATEIDANLYASIEPDMFGLQSWVELDSTTIDSFSWNADIAELFALEHRSRNLILCAPEVLGRPIYKHSEGVREFQYDESHLDMDSLLWCRPAFWIAEAEIRRRLSDNLQISAITDNMKEALIADRKLNVPKQIWNTSVKAALSRLGVKSPPPEGNKKTVQQLQDG